MITVTKIESGFAVQFPFELKDNFKSTFRSAKWHPADKTWRVGPRSKKRLDQWVAAASGAAEAIAEAEESELTQSEISRLDQELASIRDAAIRRREKAAVYTDAERQLQAVRQKIADAQAEAAVQSAALRKQADAAAQSLADAGVSVQSIAARVAEMQRWHRVKKSFAREKFETAQQAIWDAEQQLRKFGLSSAGLCAYWYVRYNRPDADIIEDIDFNSIFELSEHNDNE